MDVNVVVQTTRTNITTHPTTNSSIKLHNVFVHKLMMLLLLLLLLLLLVVVLLLLLLLKSGCRILSTGTVGII